MSMQYNQLSSRSHVYCETVQTTHVPTSIWLAGGLANVAKELSED